MSRIDELIAEHCPNGVPYLPIGSNRVSEKVVAGATPKTGRSEFWDGGTIPWMSSGEVNKGTIYETDQLITHAAYEATSTKMIPAGSVVMALAGQGKTRGTVARTRIELCTNQSLASIVVSSDMDSDFLYYFLQTQYKKLRDVSSGEGTRGGLNLQMIRSYKVPVPPLEVQREIVRILDTFSKMEAELEAELEARKQQYEHYRRHIFLRSRNVDFLPLSDVCESISAGGDRPKNLVKGQSEPTEAMPYPIFSNGTGDSALYGFTNSFRIATPAVTISARGTIGAHAIREAYFTPIVRLIVLVPDVQKISIRYLNYALDITEIGPSGGSIPQLTVPNVKKIEIPVPPMAEQVRIADALDEFDALVNDLSVGLPAELAARRQQYEYYRDNLLTFKESEPAL